MKTFDIETLKNTIVTGKVILLRGDINVPLKPSEGYIKDTSKIRGLLPTVRYLCANGAKTILMSHLGRPKNKYEEKYSIKNIIKEIDRVLGIKTHFIPQIEQQFIAETIDSMEFGEVAILENLRFYKGETENSAEFAKILSSNANIYVNDAFACSHRNHASITEITKHCRSVAGLGIEKEISSINKIYSQFAKPFCAIIGGSKISTKINLLSHLASKAQTIIIGGAMANTILKFKKINIGSSLYEDNIDHNIIESFLTTANQNKCKIVLPIDAIIKNEKGEIKERNITEIESNEAILDIGYRTVEKIESILKQHATVIMNGPLGLYEEDRFSKGTISVINTVADLTQQNKIKSIIGGGDIVACANKAKRGEDITFISLGGGAFLEFIIYGTIPGIEALINSKIKYQHSTIVED